MILELQNQLIEVSELNRIVDRRNFKALHTVIKWSVMSTYQVMGCQDNHTRPVKMTNIIR